MDREQLPIFRTHPLFKQMLPDEVRALATFAQSMEQARKSRAGGRLSFEISFTDGNLKEVFVTRRLKV